MKKVNTKNFKKTLSKFSTGITVVCVKNNNLIYGKTVNSFNSLSLKPPMVLFSLGNYSSSIKKFSKTKFLSINILSSKQKKLSDNFALTEPNLEDIKFIEGKNNYASLKIHKNNGFQYIGTIKKAGFKKNKWGDSIYMQKRL